MTERSRRPPKDPLNALLSFVYSVLTHDMAAAVSTVDLDSSVGFLHADRPGRLSLALDVLEEFRAVILEADAEADDQTAVIIDEHRQPRLSQWSRFSADDDR